MQTRPLKVTLPAEQWTRIETLLTADGSLGDLNQFVARVLDHVQQGVYRPAAWERDWLVQVLGPDTIERAEAILQARPAKTRPDGESGQIHNP